MSSAEAIDPSVRGAPLRDEEHPPSRHGCRRRESWSAGDEARIVKMDDTLRQGDDVTVRTMKGEVVALASMKVDASRVQNMERGGVATPNTVLMDANAYPRGWHQA